jgi:hypothetical protein
VRGEGILTAKKMKAIRILRKFPTAPVTLMSRITRGCSLLCFAEELFTSGFPRYCRKNILEGWRRLLVRLLTKIHTIKYRYFPF